MKRKLLDQCQERSDAGKRTAISLNNRPVNANRLLRDVKKEEKQSIVLRPTANASTNIGQILPGFGLQFGPSM